MSEIPITGEPLSPLIERRSILACYVMKAAWQTTSEGFLDDLVQSISYVARHTHFMTGEEMRRDDIEAVASSSILAQMTASLNGEGTLVLSPRVPKAVELFQTTQNIFDQLDLSFAVDDLDSATFLATARRMNDKPSPTTEHIEVAAKVWNERGVVDIKVESVADIVDAINATDYSTEVPDAYLEQDGYRMEAFDLANLKNIRSRIETKPYYMQFYEVEHGKVWLSAILEDLQRIHGEIK